MLVGDYAVNITRHFMERLDLGRNGPYCRPMAVNVCDDIGALTEQDHYQEIEQRCTGFDENRHCRGSGDAWSWSEGRGGVWSREESERDRGRLSASVPSDSRVERTR